MILAIGTVIATACSDDDESTTDVRTSTTTLGPEASPIDVGVCGYYRDLVNQGSVRFPAESDDAALAVSRYTQLLALSEAAENLKIRLAGTAIATEVLEVLQDEASSSVDLSALQDTLTEGCASIGVLIEPEP